MYIQCVSHLHTDLMNCILNQLLQSICVFVNGQYHVGVTIHHTCQLLVGEPVHLTISAYVNARGYFWVGGVVITAAFSE